ncbi:MAG: pirin family protein [Bacteroidales bacterium]|nr:pirin family protein [Bacteroidales bacterium]
MKRKVIETITGTPSVDGAGVHLVRVLGPNEVYRFDPFLMLDAFDSKNPEDYIKGFPFHPHRGIETVTYLIKGRIDHQDSLGNKGTIRDGESQWMTAGSGILHQEMPQESEHLLGLQLWINLPKIEKMTPPKYFDITADMIPEIQEPNTNIRLISGKYKNYEGVRGQHVDAFLMDIEVQPNQSFSMPTDKESNLFVYIVEGDGRFGGEEEKVISQKVAALFNKDDEFYVKAGEKGIRFVLFAGRPLKEPIAWGGPIVMNTRAELQDAFQELQRGTFIREQFY